MEEDGGLRKRKCGRLLCTDYGSRLEAPATWSDQVKLIIYNRMFLEEKGLWIEKK